MKHDFDIMNQRLQQWAKRKMPDHEYLQSLEMRIRRNTRECLHTQSLGEGLEENTSWSLRVLGAKKLAFVSIILLVGVLVGVVGSRMFAPVAGSSLSFSSEQIAARKLLYSELNTLFQGAVRWASVTDEGLQFDLAPSPIQTEENPVALRTVIARRSDDGASWIPVWQSDVMVTPNEYVSVPTQYENVDSVGLWVHRLPDGAYVVEADLRSQGKASDAQMLQFFSGDASQTVCFDAGGTQYRLCQSIAELSKETG